MLLPNGQRALGIVDEIKSVLDINDIQTHHYTWAFGAPEEEMPTEIPIVREGSANIIYRDDGKTSPFVSSYQIMKSQAKILEKVFSNMIKEENRVLLGFVRDGYGMLVPVFGDFRYIFGYEGGHVNITGKSGIAGKTSYALFLIASALSFSKKENKNLAFIAFNVKEKDLLSVNNFDYENLKKAVEDLRKMGERYGRKELEEGADMWEKAGEYGVDPVDIFKDPSAAVFYTPSTTEMDGNPGEGIKIYNYGLQDLLERGIYTFMSLFEPADINEQMESLLFSIQDEFYDGERSFNDLIK